MSTLCVIGARGGSEGLPDKNIKMLLGVPLIEWSIKQALMVDEIDHVAVSTDSENIANISRYAGADVPFLRPKELSGPDVGKFDVFKYALEAFESFYNKSFDTYVDLDCTNPLRDLEDIKNCIKIFEEKRSNGVDGVFTTCNARKNPYFNLLENNDEGYLTISKKLDKQILSRQKAPQVFEHVACIYVLSSEYVRNSNHLLDGNTIGYDIGQQKSYDIDSEHDYEIIEFLMKQKHSE